MKKNSSIEITNNTGRHQFEASMDGHQGELVYRLRGNRIYLMHTWVPEAISGQGVASALALHALKHADSQGLETVIYCPFIQNFVKNHPNWKEL